MKQPETIGGIARYFIRAVRMLYFFKHKKPLKFKFRLGGVQ